MRGQRGEAGLKALTDWIYTDAERLVGGFTNEALDEVRRKQVVKIQAEREEVDEQQPIPSSRAVPLTASEVKSSSLWVRRLLGVGAVCCCCADWASDR